MPCLSVKPSARCSFTRLAKLVFKSRTVARSGTIELCSDSGSIDWMRSMHCSAIAWPSSKSLTSVSDGCATNSTVAPRIIRRPIFRSRLASDTTVLRCTVSKAWPTSASPEMKAMALARKPITGMTPSTMMRVRTESSAENPREIHRSPDWMKKREFADAARRRVAPRQHTAKWLRFGKNPMRIATSGCHKRCRATGSGGSRPLTTVNR